MTSISATATRAGSYTAAVRHSLVVVTLLGLTGVAAAAPEEEPAPPPERDSAPAAAPEPVPDSRRLSPRGDSVSASYSTTRNGEVDARDLRLKAGVPLVRGAGFGAALMVGYGVTHLDISTAELDKKLVLHRFDATIAGGGSIAPGWSLRGSLGVAHSSDLQVATWSALQVTSMAMVHRVLGPSDGLILGLVYSSSSDLFPVLPVAGYVHQREGSPFRFEALLPRHVRVEYELQPRVRGALGIEVNANKWVVQAERSEVDASRVGGTVFGEIRLAATQRLRVAARIGMSLDSYTLPTGMDGMTVDHPLRAAKFGQLALVLAP